MIEELMTEYTEWVKRACVPARNAGNLYVLEVESELRSPTHVLGGVCEDSSSTYCNRKAGPSGHAVWGVDLHSLDAEAIG
jgi:hypothetical protein